MQPTGISFVAILFFLLGAGTLVGGVIFLVAMLRGQREDGSPPSRAAKIGCGLFALLALFVAGVLFRGCTSGGGEGDTRILKIEAPGQIFCGAEFCGAGRAVLTADRGVPFDAEAPESVIFDHFGRGRERVEYGLAGSATIWVGATRHQMQVYDLTARGDDGVLDAVVLVILRSGPEDLGLPRESTLVWPIRVHDGTKRVASGGGNIFGTISGGSNFAERLLRRSEGAEFFLQVEVDEGEPGARYVVDRYLEVHQASTGAPSSSTAGGAPR